MKSASRVLIIVGSVLCFIGVLALLITGFVLLGMSAEGNRAAIVDALKDGSMTSSYTGSPEEVAEKIQILFKALGIVFIIISVFYIVTPVISLIATGKDSKTLYIVGLIFSIVTVDLILILGNAFGLADSSTNTNTNTNTN